ncbi:MAG TPA: hypothetical protein VJ884_03360 [Salinibacter sp.]|nr:hypothetical protein [Salinibacter sp.]
MIYSTRIAVIGSLLLLCSYFTTSVQAQEWAQEVQIITTVGYGEPLHIIVDSLNSVLTRNPQIQVQRTPTDDAPIAYSELQDELLNEGLDLNSASHAFISYRFELVNGSEIVETINEMYFIYRARVDRSDLPILYVNTRIPVVNNLIRNKGVPRLTNMKSMRSFREMLAFPYLTKRQETAMVEIAGRPIREDTPQQEQLLTDFLTDQMNLGGGSYVLSMPRTTVAQVAASPSPEAPPQ